MTTRDTYVVLTSRSRVDPVQLWAVCITCWTHSLHCVIYTAGLSIVPVVPWEAREWLIRPWSSTRCHVSVTSVSWVQRSSHRKFFRPCHTDRQLSVD